MQGHLTRRRQRLTPRLLLLLAAFVAYGVSLFLPAVDILAPVPGWRVAISALRTYTSIVQNPLTLYVLLLGLSNFVLWLLPLGIWMNSKGRWRWYPYLLGITTLLVLSAVPVLSVMFMQAPMTVDSPLKTGFYLWCAAYIFATLSFHAPRERLGRDEGK